MLSMIRQKYGIIKGNSMVRSVLTSCYSCRRREAPFFQQKMADLTEDRLVPWMFLVLSSAPFQKPP